MVLILHPAMETSSDPPLVYSTPASSRSVRPVCFNTEQKPLTQLTASVSSIRVRLQLTSWPTGRWDVCRRLFPEEKQEDITGSHYQQSQVNQWKGHQGGGTSRQNSVPSPWGGRENSTWKWSSCPGFQRKHTHPWTSRPHSEAQRSI